MGLVARFRDFLPSIPPLVNQLLFQSLRILSLFYKVPDHENYLLGFFVAKEFEVEFENDFEDLELCSFEGSDLLDPYVDEEGVRDCEGEE